MWLIERRLNIFIQLWFVFSSIIIIQCEASLMLFAWLTLNCMGSMELWRIKWGWFSLRFQNSSPLQNVCIVTLWQVYSQPLTWLSLLGGRDGELSSLSAAATAAKSLQSCPTLCDPRDGSPPGSPIPGILQARTLEWVAISFSIMKVKRESEVIQSCPTPSDPMDCSLPGSSVHGIFQARVLEWGAIAFSGTLI